MSKIPPRATFQAIPTGVLGIIYAALSGRLNDQPHLKRELSYFLLLHLFSLVLAVLSAWLGYTRTLSFCGDFAEAEKIALGITVFIAGSAYLFVSQAMGQVGYRLQGGRFTRAQLMGLILSLLLAASVISLDLYVNFSSVEPVAEQLTESEADSQSKAIMMRYDSLITATQQQVQEMEAKHFTYRGKVFIPQSPTRWISQEVLDEYAGLQQELTQLRAIKIQELANDANKVTSDQGRHQREREAKVDVLGLLVGLTYFLMILAAIRAGMYAGAVWAFFETRELEKEEDRAEDTAAVADNGRAAYMNGEMIVRRGIDQEKYERFLEAAREVWTERGRYVKTDIAKKACIARDTVTTYLNRGMEQGDLERL